MTAERSLAEQINALDLESDGMEDITQVSAATFLCATSQSESPDGGLNA